MSLFSASKAPLGASVPLRKRAKSALSSNFRYTDDHDDDSFLFNDEKLHQKSISDEHSVNGSNSGESRTVKNLDTEPSAHSSEPIVISDTEPDEDSSCGRATLEKRAIDLTNKIEGSINRENQVQSFHSDDEDIQDEESSEDLGFTDTVLKRIERRQLDLLRKLAEKRTPRAIKKTRRGRPSASRDQFETIEDCWEAYLEDVPKNFFCSKEATMEDSYSENFDDTSSGRSKRPYKGLILTPKNNANMLRIYELFWKCKDDLGQPMGTFDQFRVVIGQYARFAISIRRCNKKNLCKPGMLCRILCSIKVVEAFIRSFQIRGSAGTLMNKAVHLARLAKYADTYYAERNQVEKCGHISAIVEYLNGVARSNKNECRRQATVRKEEEMRLGSNVYLTPDDLEYFAEASLNVTRQIIQSSRTYYREKNRSGVTQFLSTTNNILRKWSLNFIVSLMLHGGGQRPQVYTIIEAPHSVDFISLRDQAKKTGVFSLRISYEKRVRSVDLPSVLFPAKLFQAVQFHVKFVLPCLYQRYGMKDDDPRRKCLLLHTETGDPLSSRQVTVSMRTFLKRFDPELEKVSSMNLRASYASMMLAKHRAGETLGGMTEEKFLEYLAKIMNTSTEQLKDTYISTSTDTFEKCAAILSGLLDKEREPKKPTEISLDLFEV